MSWSRQWQNLDGIGPGDGSDPLDGTSSSFSGRGQWQVAFGETQTAANTPNVVGFRRNALFHYLKGLNWESIHGL